MPENSEKPTKFSPFFARNIGLIVLLSLVLTGCGEAVDNKDVIKEKVLKSIRYFPVETESLKVTQERIENIYSAIDSLGMFIVNQDNPEIKVFYVELVSNMNEQLINLKAKRECSITNIQDYTFYINHYGGVEKKVELKNDIP